MKTIVITRTKLVLSNLQNCNSGAEIHEVENMRRVAEFILSSVEEGTFEEAQVILLLKRLESHCTEFFIKKYKYMNK